MVQSKITSKNQTTVPKEIREKLAIGPGDVLSWDLVDGSIRVGPATRAFLQRRGSLHVGRGSTVDDVRRARARRGTESR